MALRQVTNPGFEVDLASWVKVDGDASVTWTRDTDITNGGSAGSSKLVNTVAGADDYIRGEGNITTGFWVPGTYTVTAYCNCTDFTAGALSNRGILVIGVTGGSATATLTGVTDGWVRLETSIALSNTHTGISIRLYAPQGTVYWDDDYIYHPSGQENATPRLFPITGGN